MIKNIMKNIGVKSRLNEEQRKKWEEKAANSSETVASLSNFIASMSKPEAKANPHADEIVDIYKKEIEKRNKDPKYRPEKVYEDELEARNGKKDIEQYMKAKQDIKKFEDTFKKQNEEYEARQRMGESASALSPLWGLKPNDYKNDPEYKKAVDLVKAFEA